MKYPLLSVFFIMLCSVQVAAKTSYFSLDLDGYEYSEEVIQFYQNILSKAVGEPIKFSANNNDNVDIQLVSHDGLLRGFERAQYSVNEINGFIEVTAANADKSKPMGYIDRHFILPMQENGCVLIKWKTLFDYWH